MKRLTLLVTFALVVLPLVACSSLDNAPPPGDDLKGDCISSSGNSWAILNCESVGYGAANVTELRKTVAVSIETPNPDLELGTAYLTRMSTDTEIADLILPVTNVGNGNHCFIRLEGLTYLDGAVTVATDVPGYTYIYGSTGQTTGGTLTNTCLEAGESGYFLSIELPTAESGGLYSLVDRIQLGGITSEIQGPGHDFELLPISYEVTADDTQLSISMENRGAQTVYTPNEGIFPAYVLLDENNLPLEWNFLTSTSSAINSGASGAFNSNIFYNGSASKLHVFADFKTSLTTSGLSTATMSSMSPNDRRELRDRLEAEKQEALE